MNPDLQQNMILFYPVVALLIGDVLQKMKLSGWIIPVNTVLGGFLACQLGLWNFTTFLQGVLYGAAATGLHGARKQIMPQLKGAVRRAAGPTAVLGALVLFLAAPASAGQGLTPDLIAVGGAFDRIEGPAIDLDIVPLQGGAAYTFPVAPKVSVVTAYRILAAPGGEGDETSYVNEFSLPVGYDTGGLVHLFAGPLLAVWGKGFTGEREQLYGGFGGVTFDMDDATSFVVAYRYAKSGDLKQSGLVFGPTFEIGQ